MTRVIVTDGRLVVSSAEVTATGQLMISVPAKSGLVVTALADDGSALRRPLDRALADGALGVFEVPTSEFPAGVSGQVWDASADRPCAGASVVLRRDGEALAAVTTDGGGSFAFELTSTLPLAPGRYEIAIATSVGAGRTVTIDIDDRTTVVRLGHVDVDRP